MQVLQIDWLAGLVPGCLVCPIWHCLLGY
uniref:Uncharacterized protein n=1 Tax=Arundo donax TaxID=35708 RepID=A0A0A9A6J5_ARUDO